MQTCTADTREPHVDSRWRTLAGCALVFVVMTWAYHRSPVLQLTDSLYSFLLAENLLDHQEIELDRYFPPQHSSRGYPEVAPGAELPRQMRRIDGHIYYYFPHGTAFLCLPLVAALRTKHSAVDASGGYDVQGAAWQQKWCAALVTAATCCVLFVCARLLLGMGASLLVALGAGFGTQLWSTASRAMTSHTLLVLLLAVSLLLILRERLGRGRPHLALVATLFSWSFFTRPLAVAFIVPLSLYLVAVHRRRAGWLIGFGAAWLLAFAASSWAHHGELLPPYYQRGDHLAWANLPRGLLANLFSPSRGLFVFVPLAAWVLLMSVLRLHRSSLRGLASAALASIVLHVLLASSFVKWWAGVSYGPRFTTDLVPLFALLAMLCLAASRSVRGEGVLRALGLVCLAFGALVNGAGALSPAGMLWNSHPLPIRSEPERVLDWSQAQFMIALQPERLEPRRGQPATPRRRQR